MPFTTHILFSEKLNKYYTGSTSVLLVERVKKHNYNHSGFTGKADDWTVLYFVQFERVEDSRSLEKKIKSRGALRFLQQKLQRITLIA